MREEGFFIEGGQGRLSEKVLFELKPENENYSDMQRSGKELYATPFTMHGTH